MKYLNREKFGYSLLDLLIGMAILSTVSVYSSLSLIGFRENLSWHTETEKILSTLKFTQLEAALKEVKINFSWTPRQYSVISENNDIKYQHQLPENMHFLTSQHITFYESGSVSPKSFSISFKGKTCRFIISLRGRVRKTCTPS